MKNIIKHKDEKWALIYKEFQHNSLDDLLITWEAAMFCGQPKERIFVRVQHAPQVSFDISGWAAKARWKRSGFTK